MTYRAPQQAPAVIIVGGSGAQAFDADTGAVLWELPLSLGWRVRVACAEHLVYIAASNELYVLERATGRLIGKDSLHFEVNQLVASGSRVLAASPEGVICYRDGKRLWAIRETKETIKLGWLDESTQYNYHVEGADRRSKRALALWAGKGNREGLAIILDDQVAQTDREG